MKDSSLLKVSLIVSLVGLVSLFSILSVTNISSSTIENLENYKDDTTIKISGVVNSIEENEGFSKITIIQPSYLNIVLFENISDKLNEGEKISATGKVQRFKGKTEIVARQITRLSLENNT